MMRRVLGEGERQKDVRRVVHSLVEFQSLRNEGLTMMPCVTDGTTKAQRRERTRLRSHNFFVEMFWTPRRELISKPFPAPAARKACCEGSWEEKRSAG